MSMSKIILIVIALLLLSCHTHILLPDVKNENWRDEFPTATEYYGMPLEENNWLKRDMDNRKKRLRCAEQGYPNLCKDFEN